MWYLYNTGEKKEMYPNMPTLLKLTWLLQSITQVTAISATTAYWINMLEPGMSKGRDMDFWLVLLKDHTVIFHTVSLICKLSSCL